MYMYMYMYMYMCVHSFIAVVRSLAANSCPGASVSVSAGPLFSKKGVRV